MKLTQFSCEIFIIKKHHVREEIKNIIIHRNGQKKNIWVRELGAN